jgi:hypothetical protein
VVIPEVPLSLRGVLKFGSLEVLLHWQRSTCGSDQANFSPSDFIICFYKVTL